MPSEPVEKMASSVIAPEAGPPQDIPTHDTCPQRTMRVRTRNGSTEPVDVTKIVRAVDRCCAGLSDIDPFRIVTKTINGLYDGATTRTRHDPGWMPPPPQGGAWRPVGMDNF